MKETTEVTEKKISLCSQKKHKRQKMKIMTAQRTLDKLIQSKQIRENILGNTLELTEGGGKAMFHELLKLNNLCALCG